MTRNFRSGGRVVVALAAAAWAASPAVAQDVASAYTGGGTAAAPASGAWSAAGNWSPTGVPAGGPTAELDFGGSGPTPYTSTDDLGPFTVNVFGFNSSSPATETIAGGPITFAANGTAGPSVLQNGVGGFDVSAAVVLSSPTTVGGTGTGGVTFAGPVAGPGSLLVAAAGPVTFAGANTTTGYLNVSTGAVTFAGVASNVGGGTAASAATIGGPAGRAALNVATTGTVALPAPDVGGVTGVGSAGAIGAVNQTAGTLDVTAPAGVAAAALTIGTGTGTQGSVGSGGFGGYTIAGGTLLSTSPTTGLTVGAVGTGLFTQTGGTVDLSRGGSLLIGQYGTGVVTITGGSLLGPTAAAINVDGYPTTYTAARLNLGTSAGGTGTLTVESNQGGLALAGNGFGAVNLNAGTLAIRAGGVTFGSNSLVVNFNGGTIRATADDLTLVGATPITGNTAAVYAGGAIFDTQGYTATVAATLTSPSASGFYPAAGPTRGTIPVAAGGTGYLTAPLVTTSNSGVTAVATVANGAVTGVAITSPGNYVVAGTPLTFSFAGGGATTPAPSFSYTPVTADVLVNKAGGLTKLGTGTLVLTGQNTYAGGTNISAGSIRLETALFASYSGAVGSGPVAVAAGATLDLNPQASGSITAGNPIAGAGGVRQIGVGVGTLSGVSAYTGPTVVSAGKLVLTSAAQLGNTAVTVGPGATFSPQPSYGTPVTIGSGGASLTLSPGAVYSPGSYTVKLVGTAGTTALTLGGATGSPPTLAFNASNGYTSLLAVTGGVAVGPTGALVTVSPGPGFAAGDYTVMTASAGLGTAALALGATDVYTGGSLFGLSLAKSTATAEVVTAAAVAGSLPTAVWSGAVNNVWTATAGGTSNFQTDATSGTTTGTLTPDPTTNVVFSVAAGGQNLNTVLGGDVTVNSLTFNASSAGPVSIGGPNRLTIDGFAVNGNTAGAGLTVAAGATPVTVSAPVFLNAAQTWTNNSSNPLAVTGPIAGAGGITQAGTGSLTLAGNNTFTGGLKAGGGGTLDLNSPTAAGGGTLTIASAVTLDNTSGSPVTLANANPIALNAAVTFAGSADLNLGTGPVTILPIGTTSSMAVTVNAGTLTLGGPVRGGSLPVAFTVGGPGTLALGGTITGVVGLTVNGPGAVNLTGVGSQIANITYPTNPPTFAGAWVLNGGTTTVVGAGSVTGGVLRVGGASGRAVLDLNSTGTVAFDNPDVGGITYQSTPLAGSGAIVQTAGTFGYSTGSTDYLALGTGYTPATAGYGSYTLTGGTLSPGPDPAAPYAAGIRVGAYGYGSFVQTGGTTVLGRYLAAGTAGVGVATVTGGTLLGATTYDFRIGDTTGTGTLNVGTQAGGSAVVVSQSTQVYGSGFPDGIVVGYQNGATGTVNLDAGTLRVAAGTIGSRPTSAGGASATVNLNGGTLQAGAAGLTLLDGTMNAAGHAVYVDNGGAVVDTAGYGATVAANLLGPAGAGFYPAGGTLAEPAGAGGAGYIGPPVVTVVGGSGTGATAVATVANGAVTGVTLTSPGQGYRPGDLVTFSFKNFAAANASNGGATTAAADLTYTVAANDPAVTANGLGGLTKVGAGTLTLAGADTYGGPTVVAGGVLAIPTTAALPTGTNVTVAAGATLALAAHAGGAAAVVPTVGSLSVAGTVDVANDALVVRSSSVAAVAALAAGGRLVSSAAAADAGRLTTVGVIANDDGTGTPLYGPGSAAGGTFDGTAPAPGDVLVAYAYYGDANLDGVVDGLDYARIDAGFLAAGTLTGWYNGDFNGDGVVDASDYTLIDNAFNLQPGGLAPQSPTAASTAEVVVAGTAVPEPAAVGLLATAAVAAVGRRVRRVTAGRSSTGSAARRLGSSPGGTGWPSGCPARRC